MLSTRDLKSSWRKKGNSRNAGRLGLHVAVGPERTAMSLYYSPIPRSTRGQLRVGGNGMAVAPVSHAFGTLRQAVVMVRTDGREISDECPLSR